MCKSIPLTQGMAALVDDADFDSLSAFRWYARKDRGTFYALRNERMADGRRKTVLMHRLIMADCKGFEVDHKNCDGLDNRRQNLRLATDSDNSRNRRKTAGMSRFKGVYWDMSHRKWKAQIRLEGSVVNLGRFIDEKSAALAYDVAAVLAYGQFARPNYAAVA